MTQQSIDTEDDRLRRCKEAVQAQSNTHDWKLSPRQQDDYAHALLAYMPPDCPDSFVRQIAWCYHHDHQLVSALQRPESLEGQLAWEHCRAQIPALLSYARLRWSIDSAADQEDLCQIGAQAIFQALPQFHYHSRFSTWMYQVFRHSVLRALRDRKAGKRFGQTDSYHAQPMLVPAIDAEEAVESSTQLKLLVELIDEVLAADRDQRLRLIFHLWAFRDARMADIGRITGLSQSRVSILLEHARERLRQDPRMQHWFNMLPSTARTAPAAADARSAGSAATDDDPSHISDNLI